MATPRSCIIALQRILNDIQCAQIKQFKLVLVDKNLVKLIKQQYQRSIEYFLMEIFTND